MSPGRWILAGALGLAVGAAWWLVGSDEVETPVRARLTVDEALGGADTVGYARAVEPRSFSFPEDHGPHPGFRTEWWYVTGNLSGAGGRDFGFQLTLFRSALAPERSPAEGAGEESAWRTRQAWMGHFALTDVARGRHTAYERFARGAAGLAGARVRPFRVWVQDWSLEQAADSAFPMRLRIREDGVALDLVLGRGKPPVLQGRDGLSPKGPEPGNASYYYSLTRMPARGTVTVAGDSVPVQGSAWMDREWSTSALGPELEGWDWFALQLDDGRDLMFYQLRRRDGTADSLSAGVLVEPGGASHRLGAGDVSIQVLERWTSPVDGSLYPSRWRLVIPGQGLRLEVVPRLEAQEMDLTFRYWEGAVEIRNIESGDRDRSDGRRLGVGYVELTGYAGQDAARPGAR